MNPSGLNWTGLHLPALAFDPSVLQLRLLIWPVLFGIGLYLVITSQPVGRPKPDLLDRLRRADVDERIRDEVTHRDVAPIFASPQLERILRPVLEDIGRAVRGLLARFGLGGGDELDRKLQIAGAGVEPAQFFGEKVASGAIGLGLFPLMDWLGVHPFGPWPAWLWLVGFLVGFMAPDWRLEQQLAARRSRCLMELPVLLDMLSIATSGGMALEQALDLVARESAGSVAQELQGVNREVALGQRPLVQALDAMAERNGVPELSSFVSQLRTAHEQGVPLVQALTTQAESLREAQRLRIVEEGGKAGVKMVLPIVLFILPALFVVLLIPAAMEIMHLGG